MRRFSLLMAALLFAFTLGAISDNPLIPLVNGRGVAAETNNTLGTGYSTVMVTVAWVADDSNVNETTEVAVDTGDEACAVMAMDCAYTYRIQPSGDGDAQDLLLSTCSTDQTDAKKIFSFCY
jgi:hypothetical protein